LRNIEKAGEIVMKASSLSFRAAVLLGAIGMAWGIAMAVSQDHSTMPAHAHLNLLGWVSLFLFGVFYHLQPAIDRSRMALVQVWIWIVGTTALTIGVALIYLGNSAGDPIAGISSFTILADMLLFGWIVIRAGRADQVKQRSMLPAE
jgi:FtsH-binding integral membrane protein